FPPPASRPARSSSPPAAHANGAPAVKTSPGTPKPVLPPLASLASPSDTTSFPWGFSSASLAGSLRSGPLSPAMLAGPQQQQQHHPHVNHHLAFDPSFVRTGLTPDAARSGLTPLIGGPVSFPPPSPNTTAYLAMVTNPSAASLAGPPATITPNTLSAISGVLGGGAIINANAPSVNGNHAPHPLSRSHRPTSSGSNPDASPPQHPVYTSSMQMPNANGTVEYSTSAAANGLFLLSQAHQELTKREEQQQRLQEAQRAHQTHEQPSRRAAAKRKSTSVSDDVGSSTGRAGVAASAGKRSRSSNNNNNRTRSRRRVEEDSQNDEDSEIDDEDQMMDDVQPTQSSSSRQNKKPETEEEKRKNFLERNRQAASKSGVHDDGERAVAGDDCEFARGSHPALGRRCCPSGLRARRCGGESRGGSGGGGFGGWGRRGEERGECAGDAAPAAGNKQQIYEFNTTVVIELHGVFSSVSVI
ncbi:hypothetical protein BOTBODRAFT_39163, partial [Botryobasidium botryosum FD-172 SS1]